MELQAFITTSLLEVMEGIATAQRVWSDSGRAGAINPTWGSPGEKHNRDLDFDIAVTVETSRSDGVKAGIKVVGLSLGGQMRDDAKQSTISRIRFSIPIAAPVMPVEPAAFGVARERIPPAGDGGDRA